MIGATFRRTAAVFGVDRTLVVTAGDQADAVRKEIPALPPDNLVIEPLARNTAPAVALGAVHVARRAGADALLAVLPSDAFIGDEPAFARLLVTAVNAAQQAIVTVGVDPTAPETGYGYLRMGDTVSPGVRAVAAFVEKPDLATAKQYLQSGNYLWNSGMFFFSAARLFAEAKLHLPDLGLIVENLLQTPASEYNAATARLYPQAPRISIDFGIMEKAQGIHVVPGSFGWNDVGGWAALGTMRPGDAAGNVCVGDVLIENSQNNVVLSEPGAPLIGIVGLQGMVVVATKDAVMVVPKERAQDVRLLVDALRKKGRTELL